MNKKRYSIEQIKVALALFDKLKNVTRTVRQLGYPSKNQLYEWINHRESSNGAFPEISSDGIRKKKVTISYDKALFSLEGKLAILKRCFEGTEQIRDVARELGISRVIIYKWRRMYLKNGVAGLQPKAKRIARSKTFIKDNHEGKDPTATEVKESDSEEIAKLKKQVAELQMKVDIMDEIIKIIKKDQGINSIILNNKEKSAVVDALKNKYSKPSIRKIIGLSRSSYYYVKECSRRTDKYHSLREKMKSIFSSNYCCYGYRRLKIALENKGLTVSEKVIRRLMKEENIKVINSKRKRYSSYLGELSPEVPNVINRDFSATAPGQKWLTDISEFAISAGKVYLSVIRDCFNDEIISFRIGKKATAHLANSTLIGAINSLKKPAPVIIHSDRGCHYRWPQWIEIMNKNRLIRSMSKKGCSPDNAGCEGFFGRMKNECFYNYDFKGYSLDEFITYLTKYINWYNNERIKITLKGMSPVQYRLTHQ